MDTLSITVDRKAVLDHLKATSTDWPALKSWFNGKGGTSAFAPSDIARRGSVDMALWSMRTLPPELDYKARQLSAGFAFGPDGALADAYQGATKGCPMLREGLDVLVRWIEGDASDEEAARTRMELSRRAMLLSKGPDGAEEALQALIGGFAPNAWGGCGTSHANALEAHSKLLGKKAGGGKKAAEEANGYHVFLIGDLLG